MKLGNVHYAATSESIMLNGFPGGTVVTILDMGALFAQGDEFGGVGRGLRISQVRNLFVVKAQFARTNKYCYQE